MDALAIFLIYLVPFLAIGFVAKRLIDRWMKAKGAPLSDVQAQAGPNRRKRKLFLLGIWRNED